MTLDPYPHPAQRHYEATESTRSLLSKVFGWLIYSEGGGSVSQSKQVGKLSLEGLRVGKPSLEGIRVGKPHE